MASSNGRLILICGLPASGKTTLARRLINERDAVWLSGDDWMADLGIDLWNERARDRLEQRFWALAQDLLRHGMTVILDSGFWLRSDRDEKRLGARSVGARVELHYLPTALDELVRRLDSRNDELPPGTAPILRTHIEDWQARFQAPDEEELALFDPPIDKSTDTP